jgi:hypothetical protein
MSMGTGKVRWDDTTAVLYALREMDEKKAMKLRGVAQANVPCAFLGESQLNTPLPDSCIYRA